MHHARDVRMVHILKSINVIHHIKRNKDINLNLIKAIYDKHRYHHRKWVKAENFLQSQIRKWCSFSPLLFKVIIKTLDSVIRKQKERELLGPVAYILGSRPQCTTYHDPISKAAKQKQSKTKKKKINKTDT